MLDKQIRPLVVLCLVVLIGGCTPVPTSGPASETPTSLVVPTGTPEMQRDYLSDLTPVFVKVGYGQLGIGRYDLPENQGPIQFFGKLYKHGLVTHAPARVDYDLNGNYQLFKTTLLFGEYKGDGVIFKVLVDDQEKYSSPVMDFRSTPIEIEVDVSKAKKLSLLVLQRQTEEYDVAIWGDPYLIRDNSLAATGPDRIETPSITPTPIKDVSSVFLPGAYLGPFTDAELHPDTVKRTLTAIKEQLGATSITIQVQWFQQDITSTEIRPLYDRFPATVSDDKLAYLIQTAHDMGFTVLLIPLVGPETFWDATPHLTNQAWHQIVPTDAWWDSYSTYVNYYAAFAQENHVEMYYIHAELLGTIKYSAQWEKIIEDVRRVYSGPIGAAINSGAIDEYYPWLEQLDFIGTGFMGGFNNGIKNMTVPEIVAEVNSFPRGEIKNLAYVENLHTKYNKPIIFYETNNPSFDGAAGIVESGTVMERGGVSPDLQEQADYFEALFRSFYSKPWLLGITIGDWFMFDSGGCWRAPDWPISLSVVDKPAATVVRSWFTQSDRQFATPLPLRDDGHVDIGFTTFQDFEQKLDFPCHNIPPIFIDGKLDDWAGISPLIMDPVGDNDLIETPNNVFITPQEAEGPHDATDLTALYAYRTPEYLVIAIEGASGLNRELNYQLFLDFNGDNVRDVGFGAPEPPYEVLEWDYYGNSEAFIPHGFGRYSEMDEVLEMAIPLEFFGYPQTISIQGVAVCYCHLPNWEHHDVIGDPNRWYEVP